MKLGLHLSNFTYAGGPPVLAADLKRIAATAEEIGFDNLTVMDHVWQIGGVGPKENDMLEAYTALGFLAAVTTKIRLFTVVTAVTYRSPGLLAKAISSVDVLSGGRATLGIGAAWNEEEAIGLGLGYAPTAVRFEMLEEALQIILQMWSDNDGPYEGKHFQLGSTLNSPQPLQRPRPRIMIAGGGVNKTLRMVAQYADACNIGGGAAVGAEKLAILRTHCETLGRNYDDIEKTSITGLNVGPNGDNVGAILDELRGLHEAGFSSVHCSVPGLDPLAALEIIGRDIIPVVSAW